MTEPLLTELTFTEFPSKVVRVALMFGVTEVPESILQDKHILLLDPRTVVTLHQLRVAVFFTLQREAADLIKSRVSPLRPEVV